MHEIETLRRAETPHGEVALRRRGEVIELVVNGVFAMDSVETRSEVALADVALDGLPGPARVLVGGLGLGYTAARLLDQDVTRLDVVELAAPLVDWAREGVTEQLGRVAGDPRVRLHAGDVAEWITEHADPWDAVLLDVDNGPSFLIHDHNARVYGTELLARFVGALSEHGRLVIWCEARSPELWSLLRTLDPAASEIVVPISREGRSFDYALYLARRPA